VEWFDTTLIKTPGRAPVTRKAGEMSAESRFLELTDEPGGAVKAVSFFNDERKRDPKSAIIREVMVNRIGYELLQEGDTKGAIEIFKANVAAHPDSPNAYDSLGDAYLADGQRELARENAKKTLELLATDKVDDQARKDGIKASAESKLK
jgi:tetratricopeptide (TPR) repeat protein